MIKEAFSYKGTINRKAYIVSLVTYFVLLFLSFSVFARLSGAFFGILFLIVFIGLHIYLFGKGTRRCHDLGKKGWEQFSFRTWLGMLSREIKVSKSVSEPIEG
ncbi:hypothetical protein MODO_3566 [Myroides odoratimimus]|uniref:DUF4133 domain-containing protein n=1 Tax=Myroides odoratimimus CCUG 10230 TaxID=883150 RepID=A0ABP2NET0_9FLAO|nr:DUF805 domain-containing protein [Myroides odoratimimus]EHO11963.1 hypothetical protein HMPREF9712_00210 [Myroides odoratimimus CCUG 10230]GAQ15861.1 hypothetical protein MODO_3566 [Myroides odoratimimus]STZ47693.1 Predicted membrane protein [Myroides odoratimimus]